MKPENIKEFKFWLAAVSQSDEQRKDGTMSVLHICGYMNSPTDEDKRGLELELNKDEEFGLVGRINKDVFVINCPKGIPKQIISKVKPDRCTIHDQNHNEV